MATKKIKVDLQVEAALKLPNKTANRALIIDGSGDVVESTVTDTELAYVSGVTSDVQTQLGAKIDTSERGANNGVAELDATGKLTAAQIPAISITTTTVVATEIAQLALTVQEGDVAVRTDENKSYIALNATNATMADWQVLLTPTDAVTSVNTQTGVVVLDADDISDAATANKFVTAGDITTLGNTSGINNGDEVQASTTVQGIAEIATVAEIDGKTDDITMISPLGLAGSQIQTDVTANNAKVSADGLVTTHSDVTDAGSGAIITTAERTKVGHLTVTQAVDLDTIESDTATNNAKVTNATHTGDVTGATALTIAADAVTGAKIRLDNNEFMRGRNNLGSGDINILRVSTSDDIVFNTTPKVGANTVLLTSDIIDEDDMTSNSATKVPTQQSVKAYVDTEVAGAGSASAGDLNETSFAGAADTATNLPVTGFAFANGTVRSFDAHVSVLVDTADLYETFRLQGIQKGASWDMSVEAVGDDSAVSFTITPAGQIQYSKTTTPTWTATTIKFRAITTSVA